MNPRHLFVLVSVPLWLAIARPGFAQTATTVLVRHALSITGTLDGSVQQLLPESVAFNGGSTVTADLFVPGTPAVQLNGQPNFSGTINGTGNAAPSNYQITLNGNVTLRNVVRRTDPVAWPIIAAPSAPVGTRNVTLSSSGQTAGDFATLRNLTVNGSVGQVVVPPGTYGDFVAAGGNGFTIGVAGGTAPAVYNLQQLRISGGGQVQIVGPVVITVAGNVSLAGTVGSAANLGWLQLRVASGDVTLNPNTALYGSVTASNGTLLLNATSQLVGGATSDRLTIASGALLRAVSMNVPPAVALTSPAANAIFSAPATVLLQATASDADGSVAKVEFFNGTAKLGEAPAPPYQYTWTGVPEGTYALTAKATDNLGATTSSSNITITVAVPANQAPAVALTSPPDGSVYFVPASLTLSATASDPDGTINKVEFYRNGSPPVKLGEASASPFNVTWVATAPGNYALTAKAYDNAGGTATSVARTVTLQVGLPYFTGFEVVDGYIAGPLAGQAGWTSGASISDTLSFRGAQSMLLPATQPVAEAAHTFPSYAGQSTVFVDVFAKPAAVSDPPASGFVRTNVAQVALVQSAGLGEIHVFSGNGTGGGTWRPTGFKVPLSTSGQASDWLRLTLRQDFSSKKWDVYGNGRLAAFDVGFLDATTTLFSRIAFTGAQAPAVFDDLYLGFDHPLFANASKDGIDDAWKTTYGLDLTRNVRDEDPDRDGLTNIQEFLLGTKPNSADSDTDGMPDGWEVKYGLNPVINDASGDLIGDGVSNLTKYLLGRNPTKPALPDTGGAVNLRVFLPSR